MNDDRILVWGAGAIGGTVGAALRRAGHDVTFIDVVPEHVDAIRDRALSIFGPVEEFSVQAPALLPAEVAGAWPCIFLCVKAHHTEAACRALLPHLADDGYVLSLQNGLCETIIADIVGRGRTVGAFVNFGADWMGPGEILFGNRGAVVLGELDGASTPRLAALHALMRDFEPDAVTTPDIWSYLWGKLGYGSMLFAQALGDKGIADCLARPELLPVWRAPRLQRLRPRRFPPRRHRGAGEGQHRRHGRLQRAQRQDALRRLARPRRPQAPYRGGRADRPHRGDRRPARPALPDDPQAGRADP